MPVDILAAVEWKKLMWCWFSGKAPRLVLVAGLDVKVVCVVKEEKSLEVRVKDARVPALYRVEVSEEGFVRRMNRVIG